VSESGWPNYFNYFTEVEEHFQKARGTSLFLLSPLDWALIESWKNSGVPLEAVLRGIDAAFEKWRAKRSRAQLVNSLAFCAQPVMVEAQRMADAGVGSQADVGLQAGAKKESRRRSGQRASGNSSRWLLRSIRLRRKTGWRATLKGSNSG